MATGVLPFKGHPDRGVYLSAGRIEFVYPNLGHLRIAA
jgi:hypothetical protein